MTYSGFAHLAVICGILLSSITAVNSCAIPITIQEALLKETLLRHPRSASNRVVREHADNLEAFDSYIRIAEAESPNKRLEPKVDGSGQKPLGATDPSGKRLSAVLSIGGGNLTHNASTHHRSSVPQDVAKDAQIRLNLTLEDLTDLLTMFDGFGGNASEPAGGPDYAILEATDEEDSAMSSAAIHSGNEEEPVNEDVDPLEDDLAYDSEVEFVAPGYGNSAQFEQQQQGFFPTIDAIELNKTLVDIFSKPRNDDKKLKHLKDKARSDIIQRFLSYGLKTWTHNFTADHSTSLFRSPFYSPSLDGMNIVGVLPGTLRKDTEISAEGRTARQSAKDNIILIGAHYDTVRGTNGVNDNGSGMAVMMEIARTLTKAKCRLRDTVMFVAFDLEELGGLGSRAFVHEYLIPQELLTKKSHFVGAYILDTILNYNASPMSQIMPGDFKRVLPSLARRVARAGHRGDFVAMISRKNSDSLLVQSLGQAWTSTPSANPARNSYKLLNMATDLPAKMPSPRVLTHYSNFLRSDHFMFWYPNHTDYKETLSSVLISDLGPFRGLMKFCYHRACDNVANFATEENIRFAKKTADSLLSAVLTLGKGSCPGPRAFARINSVAGSLTPQQLLLTLTTAGWLKLFFLSGQHKSAIIL